MNFYVTCFFPLPESWLCQGPFPSSDAMVGKEEADCFGSIDLYRKRLARKVWGLDLE